MTCVPAELPTCRPAIRPAVPEGTVVLDRPGRRPLRFRGYLARRDRCRDADGSECELALWHRQDRRMAVSLCQRGPQGEAADAVVVPDLEAALDWVESLCAGAADLPVPSAEATPAEMLEFIDSRYRDRLWRDRLGLMAAGILAKWQDGGAGT